jgi:hypothetical protein
MCTYDGIRKYRVVKANLSAEEGQDITLPFLAHVRQSPV